MWCVVAEGKCSLFNGETDRTPALVIDLVNPPTPAQTESKASATKTEAKRDDKQTRQARAESVGKADTDVLDAEKEYPVGVELTQQHHDYSLRLRYFQRYVCARKFVILTHTVNVYACVFVFRVLHLQHAALLRARGRRSRCLAARVSMEHFRKETRPVSTRALVCVTV